MSSLWKEFIEGEGAGMGTRGGCKELLSPPASAVPLPTSLLPDPSSFSIFGCGFGVSQHLESGDS